MDEKIDQPPLQEQNKGFHYHYSRADRLSIPGAPRLSGKRGILRGNRSLLILLLDVVLILVIVIATRLLAGSPATDRGRIADYSFVLRALAYENTVLATVTASKTSNTRTKGQVQIKFHFGEGGEEVYSTSQLPTSEQEPLTIATSIPWADGAKILRAEVSLDGERIVLSRSLETD